MLPLRIQGIYEGRSTFEPSSQTKSMEETLNAVGRLIVQALPTFFLVVLLHFYLKAAFFAPMARLMAERREATEGARKRATEALDRANARAAEYEEQIRAARNDIYREQEQMRKQWRDEQSSQVEQARSAAAEQVRQAKAELQAQAEGARRSLAGEVDALANRITETILHGRAA